MKKFIFAAAMLFLCMATQAQHKTYVVSNAHFDSQWNWDVQRSISDYIPKTLNQNLMLLEKFPNYIFNFEGGVKYQWMKEYYPHQYALIKDYIKQGRWHISGSTWDATDTTIPSPESFSRNILYGQQFYKDEFGVESTDIFLPDCFGFGWTLPTIAAHSGVIGFSTQKLHWRHHPFYGDKKVPFEIGLWQGVDGSRIMLVAEAFNYTTRWKDEDLSNSKYLYDLAENSPLKTVYHYYGTGDTGGAPTIESVMAVEKGVAGKGPVEIISATSDQLFKDYQPYDKHPELEVHNGELLMDVHGTGCYTSQAAMKLYNRRNELLADASERAAVVADWLGAVQYPQQTINEAWKRFIWHQFHDDLTGTSIPRAYEFSWNDELISLQQFSNVLSSSVGGASRALNTQVKGSPLVIFNPLGFAVSEIVEVDLNKFKVSDKVSVYDEKGVQVPSQLIKGDDGSARLLVAASLPAVGYAVYDLRSGGSAKSSKTLSVDSNSIENSLYKLTLNANGDISSIVDKRNGKQMVESGKAIRLALFTENESFAWPAWEILKKVMDKEPISISDDVRITIAEKGPLRASLCVERKHGDSFFKQYIRLSEGGQAERIDVVNEIDWQSTNALLKAEFPLNISNSNATYDLGVGAIERGNNTETAYEVYAQYWADLTDKAGDYGVSVMNDSKYGWDKPNDNTIRLTLLHTPKTKGGYAYQNKQDFGKHTFVYSIMGHKGDYRAANTVLRAEILNQPMKAFTTAKHEGALGRNFSFASSDNDKVVVKALKKAEGADEYVVRFYETEGLGAQKVNFTFPSNIVLAQEVSGVEKQIGDAAFNGNKLSFEIKPFGMKSFKVKLNAPKAMLSEMVSMPVALPYNMKTASYNAYRSDANFDSRGNSYAAELLPEQIDFKGVKFNLSNPALANGVKCRQDTVALPEGKYNRLYLLATSTDKDYVAEFIVDGVAHKAVVPSYTGFVGQWGHTGHTEAFLKSSDIAYIGTHKHNMMQNKDVPYEFTYMFSIALDIPFNSRQLILPVNSKIVIFAATLINDQNNAIVPVNDLMRVGLPIVSADSDNIMHKNLTFGKPIIGVSGEVRESEAGRCLVDDDINTKWCDISDVKPKFVDIDLQRVESIRGWHVFNAGLESLDFIAKEYSLQVKQNLSDDWTTVDTVYDNTALETDRLLKSPVKARYVRLSVSKPDQSEGNVVRIYELSVY